MSNLVQGKTARRRDPDAEPPGKVERAVQGMFEALEEHVDAIERETKTIGLVILRGAGGNFSAGYDMAEVLEQVRAHAKPHYHSEVIQKVANLPQPVISAVQGHCSTGAMELALAADLIVASESAQVRGRVCALGLTPVWGLSLRLPHRVGYRQGQRNDVHLPQLFGKPGARHASGQFLLSGRSFRGGTAPAGGGYPGELLVCQPGQQAGTDGQRRSLTLRAAHALELFKNEGLAPDAAQRVGDFFERAKPEG